MDRFSSDPLRQARPLGRVGDIGGTGDAGGSQRSQPRDSLFLLAQLRFDGEELTREVRVRNLSEGGLMVDCDRVEEVGTPVTLDLRGIGAVGGKVAWCTEGRVGIALDRQIDPMKARKPLGATRD